jgi:hypothetical protein
VCVFAGVGASAVFTALVNRADKQYGEAMGTPGAAVFFIPFYQSIYIKCWVPPRLGIFSFKDCWIQLSTYDASQSP